MSEQQLPTKDRLLSQTAALEHLRGLSPRTLERGRRVGGGPAYVKLGNRVAYRLSELERVITARERTYTSDPGPER